MERFKKLVIYMVVILLLVPTNLVGTERVEASSGSCAGKWELATDDDFSGSSNGNFQYVGNHECVEIPHTIKGVSVTSYSHMFSSYKGSQLKGVKSTNGNVTDMIAMFNEAWSLTELDLSNFDTSSVTDMRYMFYEASSLTELDLSSFDTSSVTNMDSMFGNASSLTELDLSSFDTSNVTDMRFMFYGASSLTSLDLSSFDTSNVTNMYAMFGYAIGLTELDLSSFDTSNVTDMGYMFSGVNATKGYAGTQADADRFNDSSGKPSGLIFCVKGNCDFEPPTVSLSNNGGDWSQSHSTRINASDSGSGVDKVEYRWTTGTSFPTSGFTTVSNGTTVNTPTSTGNHYLHVRATDNAGNVRQFTSSVFRVDNTVPTEPTISGGTEWQKDNQTITISQGEDDHSGVDKTQYRLDGGSWQTYNGEFTILKEGSTKVEARTLDKAGNVSSIATKTIKMDKTAPVLTITPNTTSITHEDVVLTAKATDSHSGVKRIKLPDNAWVNGSTANYTVKENGTYTFVVEDNAGNITTETYEVTNIDKTISFERPDISSFGEVVLGDVDTASTDVSSVIVKDWREGNNEWKVNVQATKLTNGKHTLPNGMLMLNGLSDIKRVDGSGALPTKGFTGKKAIDEGQVNLVTSENARGEYELVFPEDTLEIKVDPSIMKKGTYESTISWELVNAP